MKTSLFVPEVEHLHIQPLTSTQANIWGGVYGVCVREREIEKESNWEVLQLVFALFFLVVFPAELRQQVLMLPPFKVSLTPFKK